MARPSSRHWLLGGMAGIVAAAIAALLLVRIGDPEDLEAQGGLSGWMESHPESVSFLVLDASTGEEIVSWKADAPRPTVGLPTLLLATEYARQAEAGLDTTYQVAASILERRRLPVLDAEAPADQALALPDLVSAALRGDRAAADELLRVLSRESVEALPDRIGASGLDAPVPVGGLLLAWSPTNETSADSLTAHLRRFARAPRTAQRDSAFAADRAYLNSASVRAARLAQLQRNGLAGPAADRRAAAASFPRGSARAYADLLADALRGSVLSPSVSARVVRSMPNVSPDPALGDTRVASAAAMGLVGAAAIGLGADDPAVAVLMIEGLPDAPDQQAGYARDAVSIVTRWARTPRAAAAFRDRMNSSEPPNGQ